MRPPIQCLGIGTLAATALGVMFSFGQPLPALARTIALADGSATCEGNFSGLNGSGLCVYSKPSGGAAYNYYRGAVRNGLPSGNGIFVYQNSDRYEGAVRNGKPNGYGQFLFANNDRYIGNFRNGSFHGAGRLIYGKSANANSDLKGFLYVGNFRNGQPHGKGTMTSARGTYTGDFYLGQVNGRGVFVDASGVRCEGNFLNNTMMGSGTCTYPKGNAFRTYTGELRGGKPDGAGTVTYANGKQTVGLFSNGRAVVQQPAKKP